MNGFVLKVACTEASPHFNAHHAAFKLQDLRRPPRGIWWGSSFSLAPYVRWMTIMVQSFCVSSFFINFWVPRRYMLIIHASYPHLSSARHEWVNSATCMSMTEFQLFYNTSPYRTYTNAYTCEEFHMIEPWYRPMPVISSLAYVIVWNDK